VASGVSPLRLKVYPGAFHDFDVDKPERLSNGHKLGYSEAATADARNEVTAFLRHYLQ
jgi:dienelactone hydrolase